MTTTTIERPTVAPLPAPVADPDVLEIEVRQTHIDRGKAKNGLACPIALAAREWLGGSDGDVAMGPSMLRIRERYWHGGSEANSFTLHFDLGLPVHPQTLTFTRARQTGPLPSQTGLA